MNSATTFPNKRLLNIADDSKHSVPLFLIYWWNVRYNRPAKLVMLLPVASRLVGPEQFCRKCSNPKRFSRLKSKATLLPAAAALPLQWLWDTHSAKVTLV